MPVEVVDNSATVVTNNSTAGSMTADLSTLDMQDGDRLFLHVGTRWTVAYGLDPLPTPSGWTAVGTALSHREGVEGFGVAQQLWCREWSTGDPDFVTVTLPSPVDSNNRRVMVVSQVRGWAGTTGTFPAEATGVSDQPGCAPTVRALQLGFRTAPNTTTFGNTANGVTPQYDSVNSGPACTLSMGWRIVDPGDDAMQEWTANIRNVMHTVALTWRRGGWHVGHSGGVIGAGGGMTTF